MSMVPDYSLFPNKEEWGTGDEAMDNRLSVALKKVKDDLTLENISEFYFYGLSLRPRAYNPAFHTTIELVTKAFIFCLEPDGYNDQLMQKMKGGHASKKKVIFELSEVQTILNELKTKKMYRYKGQIDFYLHHQDIDERNPFVRHLLKRAPIELHAKITLKDFKAYLSGEKDSTTYSDPFFHALRMTNQILLIENLGEFWYHQGQIFSFPLFDI
ncbi:MAG: hypothetical protein H7336_07025 [Bacteriovorax sp.]|nr:hypothetical protein [Bacteriovorax sp.]